MPLRRMAASPEGLIEVGSTPGETRSSEGCPNCGEGQQRAGGRWRCLPGASGGHSQPGCPAGSSLRWGFWPSPMGWRGVGKGPAEARRVFSSCCCSVLAPHGTCAVFSPGCFLNMERVPRNHLEFFPTHLKRLVFQPKACWIKLNFSLRWAYFPNSDVHTEICQIFLLECVSPAAGRPAFFSCGPPDRKCKPFTTPVVPTAVYFHRDLDISVFSQELRLSGLVAPPCPLSHPGDRAQVGWAAGEPQPPPQSGHLAAQLQPQILVVQGSRSLFLK